MNNSDTKQPAMTIIERITISIVFFSRVHYIEVGGVADVGAQEPLRRARGRAVLVERRAAARRLEFEGGGERIDRRLSLIHI